MQFNHRIIYRRSAAELPTSDVLFLSLIGKVVELGVFEKNYNSTSEMVDDDSSDSEDENESSKEYFYSPDDSKASDSPSVKSCNPTTSEGKRDSEFSEFEVNLFLSCSYVCRR